MSSAQKILILFLVVLLIVFFGAPKVFAYNAETTHAALTSEIIDFYNLLHPEKTLTFEQKKLIIEGAILEDTPPRWVFHSFDPIHQIGWTGEKAGKFSADAVQIFKIITLTPDKVRSAVEWVNNESLQDNYSRYEGNRTWKQALKYYTDGDSEASYKTLGYVLHLLEDMSVPDHTRNDPHVEALGGVTGDYGSPYEQYTNKWNISEIKKLNIPANLLSSNAKPPVRSSIEEYLESLAQYSNKYFFSKDTINDLDYENPKILREDENFGYGLDENNKEFSLARTKRITDDNGNIKTTYVIDIGSDPILDAYFSRLSKQAVLYGAGVIDLFNKQSDEAVINKEFSTRVVKYDFSWFETPIVSLTGELNKLKGGAQSFFANLSNTVQNAAFNIVKIFNPSIQKPTPIKPNENLSQKINNELLAAEAVIIEPIAPAPSLSLFEIKNQLDDLSDQLDDLSFKAKTQNSGLIEINSTLSLKKEDLATEAAVAVQTQSLSSGSGGGGGSVSSPARSFPKLIINEIQLASASSTHEEFVELYNPNASAVDLTDWYLQKKTASGASFTTFAAKDLFASKTIPAHGYFLVAHPSSTFVADIFTSYGVADNNTLALKNPNGEIIDKVGWGEAYDCESGCALNPEANQSIQRKFSAGIFVDSENNVSDFELQTCPSPKAQSRNCDVVPINQKPNASFVITPSVPAARETVIFDASSSTDPDGSIASYAWNFGDGQNTSSTQTTSTHSYLASGNYTVRLVVFDNNNSSSTIGSILSVASSTSSNQAPNAFFVYTPENPQVGDIITFNAASSTDDGAIISYQWNFGDNTTSAILTVTTTHTYSQASSYQASLIVFDNQNASSTISASLTVSSSTANGPNHILISEIQVAGTDVGDEFIELYNAGANEVDLSDWSIQYLGGGATSTENVSKKNFASSSRINSKGFFLVARALNASSTDGYRGVTEVDVSHRTFSLSGLASGAKIFLVSNKENISSFEDSDIVDSVDYFGLVPPANQSIERKALSGGVCVSAQGEGEFLGNECDIGVIGDFDLSVMPKPQNTNSLPEPRSAPVVSNFNGVFGSSTANIDLSWGESTDSMNVTSSVVYELRDGSSTIIFTSTSTFQFSQPVNDIGRDYTFSLRAFDKDGLGGATSTIVVLASGDGITRESPVAFSGIKLESVIRKPDGHVQVRYTVTSDLDTSKHRTSFNLFRVSDGASVLNSIAGISPSLQKTASSLNEFAASASCFSDFKWGDYQANIQYVIDFPSRYTNWDIQNGDALGLSYSYVNHPCVNGPGGATSGALIIYEVGEDRRPNIISMRQIKIQTSATISEESKTIENPILAATIESPVGNNIKLEVELRQVSEAFAGVKNYESGFVSSGSKAQINISGLAAGSYHWRARVVDDKNNASRWWSEFGTVNNIDFEYVIVPALLGSTSTFYGVTLDGIVLKSDGGLEVKFTTVDIDSIRNQATVRFVIKRVGDDRSLLLPYLSTVPSLNTSWQKDPFYIFGTDPAKNCIGNTTSPFSQYVNGTQYTITYPTELVDPEMFAGNQVYLQYETTNFSCWAIAPNFSATSTPFVEIQNEAPL